MSFNRDHEDYGKTLPKNRFTNPVLPSGPLRFRMETQKDDFIYKPEERQFSFYQICQFPVSKLYSVRKIIYDEFGEMITYRENKLKKDVLDKFLKKSPEYKYTIYPAYDLDVVGFPEPNEILTAKSQILNEY
ncbi:hypothetical protein YASMINEVIRUS_428 [Yasminevirus sp. GU-2018]|uniref:Uncharacterized protein n=1 Tax=Yasminevirus sp. GU-2018 TaxID=2420051 RepID=A0A5K0U832_9VIRU|nr:hypothetical protein YASMINEVIRUS_428 [Yasminevirus sp. GU-2018]